MSRSVLIVEDEQTTRDAFELAFRTCGWEVAAAASPEEALELLGAGQTFAAVILDIVFPDSARMNGVDFLTRVREMATTLDAVFVVSGHFLEPDYLGRLLELGPEGFLPKPVRPGVLPVILNAFLDGTSSALAGPSGGLLERDALSLHIVEHEVSRNLFYLYTRHGIPDADELPGVVPASLDRVRLDERVRRRETALVNYFQTTAKKPVGLTKNEPLLVVARKWNSWYPSFFDVNGGAYLVLAAKATDGIDRAVVIDPGFRSLSALNAIGFPVSCMKTCVITHNHPDHLGGVFEYISSRHALDEGTTIYCAESVHCMLDRLSGSGLDVKAIDQKDFDVVPPYEVDCDGRRSLRATPFATAHSNVGSVEGTKGILLSSLMGSSGDDLETRAELAVLGDTEYRSDRGDPSPLFDSIRKFLLRPELCIAALHIGSSQLKQGTGKHLYMNGMISILKDIDHFRRTNHRSCPRLLVLISEWGLEHAPLSVIEESIPTSPAPPDLVSAFDDSNLLIETVSVLRRAVQPEKLDIIPADSGLIVGMESGRIYTQQGTFKLNQIHIHAQPDGLHYDPC